MAQAVKRYIVNVTTAGSAGSATGDGYSKAVNGFVVGMYFDFHASAPATTDTTVTDVATGRTLLTLSNTATDAFHVVYKQGSDNTGTAISGVYSYCPVDGEIKISLAQCDALTNAVQVHLYVLEG